jgi:hypothetical protein
MQFITKVALLAGLAVAAPAGTYNADDDCYEYPTEAAATTAVAPPSYTSAAPPAYTSTPSTPDGGPQKFGLIAIRSGSPIQNTGITASKGSLFVGGTQDAQCDSESNFATFYLADGAAYLYAASATPQQLWVDRSGMGQGVTGYTTGAQPAPRNAERTGFSISDRGYLVFDGMSPLACPGANGQGYSLWFTTAENPGGNTGCLGVALRTVDDDTPVSCRYSESS